MTTDNKSVEAQLKELQEKEKCEAEFAANVEDQLAKAASQIILSIGGTEFVTSRITLTSQKGSFFDVMLSNHTWKPDSQGRYFIDRDPGLFPIILWYLRTGKYFKREDFNLADLITELRFYRINIPEFTLPKLSLLDYQQHEQITQWIPAAKFTKLYSASVDGFTANAFHSRCDNKGRTLVLAQSVEGYLFGGYASTSWESSAQFKPDPNAFLFTLTNPHSIPPTKFPIVQIASAVHCEPTRGPCFGAGNDIYIPANANDAAQLSTFIPTSYNYTGGKGELTFTGSKLFTLKELEVYLVH